MANTTVYNILHVDDDIQFLDMVRIMLSDQNFNIDTAVNGSEAVTKAFRNRYNLIIMDVMMPIMDGRTASRTIKRMSPKIPILALTACNYSELSDFSLDYMLRKPVTKNELIATIMNILKKENK